MPSMPNPSTAEEQPPSPGRRPNLLVSFLAVLASLAVIASGWGVARLAVGSPPHPLDVAEGPETRPPRSEAASSDADPEDAGAYVAAAANLVEGSSAFHITFTVHHGQPGPQSTPGRGVEPDSGGGDAPPSAPLTDTATDTVAGQGHLMYDSQAEPEFDHSFTTVEGSDVYRYDVGDGQLVMTADRGLELLDPPSAADRYLCSRDFGAAKLREVLGTSTDLALEGMEEVELEWPGMHSTHSAYHYTGTFTAILGGYDTESGSNTLTTVEDAEFQLWIDELGYPRRLDYRAEDGVGESYEYHSFN